MHKGFFTPPALLAVFLITGLLAVLPNGATARSAFSPRHSGLEAPGSPKSIDVMPGRGIGHTPDGGRGHVDAYGNPVRYPEQQEKPEKKRLRPGGYDNRPMSSDQGASLSRLPDNTPPVWNFR